MFLLIWWQVALLVSLAQILLQLRVQFTIAQLDPQILVLVIHDNIYTCHLSISFRTVVHLSISITSFLLFVQTAQITFDNNVVHAAVFEFYLQLILTGKCLNTLANRLRAFSYLVRQILKGRGTYICIPLCSAMVCSCT